MKNTLLPALLLSFLLLLAAGSCKKKTECVDGNGDFKMETRQTGDFDMIASNGAFKITFSQLDDYRVDVFAESNILPLILSNVVINTLFLEVEKDACYNSGQPVEITLTAPDLKSVTMTGSEMFTANNLNVDNLGFETHGSATVSCLLDVKMLAVSVIGSGDYNLAGSTGKGNISIPGSGTVYASALQQDSCEVAVSGSGDAYLFVRKYLHVVISGSGNVYYKGNPEEVVSEITGSGKLINEGK